MTASQLNILFPDGSQKVIEHTRHPYADELLRIVSKPEAATIATVQTLTAIEVQPDAGRILLLCANRKYLLQMPPGLPLRVKTGSGTVQLQIRDDLMRPLIIDTGAGNDQADAGLAATSELPLNEMPTMPDYQA